MQGNYVTQEHIDNLLKHSDKKVSTEFGKTTVVTVKLPNGYTLTESSGCVNPDNYDPKYGEDICMGHIEDQLWKLEGYLLQDKVYDAERKRRGIKEDNKD